MTVSLLLCLHFDKRLGLDQVCPVSKHTSLDLGYQADRMIMNNASRLVAMVKKINTSALFS